MLLRSHRVINNRMLEDELEKEGSDDGMETREWEEGVREEDGRKEEGTKERLYERKDDLRFEQLLELVKQINVKVNKEMGEVKMELKQEVERMIGEVKRVSDRWEEECLNIKRNWDREVGGLRDEYRREILDIRKEIQNNRKEIADRKNRDEASQEKKEREKNRKIMDLLYEDINECKASWIEKFAEMKEGMEERVNRVEDDVREIVKCEVNEMERRWKDENRQVDSIEKEREYSGLRIESRKGKCDLAMTYCVIKIYGYRCKGLTANEITLVISAHYKINFRAAAENRRKGCRKGLKEQIFTYRYGIGV